LLSVSVAYPSRPSHATRTRICSSKNSELTISFRLPAGEPNRSFCVDEATGNDSTGDGSPSAPYKTVVGAFIAHGDSITALVRQATEGVAEPSWEPATASAIKKAKKLLAQHQTKLARQEELRRKDEVEGAAKRALELKKLEDAKSIVLEEPASVATKIKIKQAVEKRGERVRIFGWVHRLRQQGAMIFVVLRDGTGFIQCVLTGKLVSCVFVSRRSGWKLILFVDYSPKPTMPSLSPSSRLSKSPEPSLSSQKARPLLTTTSSPPTGLPSSARHQEETRRF
jgi:hypothetical protein